MSAKKRARVVAPPPSPVPDWIPLFEERGAAAGLKVERHRDRTSSGSEWWISVEPPGRQVAQRWEERVCFFGPRNFIAVAQIQDLPPRDLVNHANMVQDLIAIIAPELFEPSPEPADVITATVVDEIPF